MPAIIVRDQVERSALMPMESFLFIIVGVTLLLAIGIDLMAQESCVLESGDRPELCVMPGEARVGTIEQMTFRLKVPEDGFESGGAVQLEFPVVANDTAQLTAFLMSP